MTKQMKQFTIDFELIEMLEKEENMSGLINDLLHNHFNETHDFKKLRIMNKLKLLKQQEKEFKFEKERVEQEVKAFLGKEKEEQDEREAKESIEASEEGGYPSEKCGNFEEIGSGEIETE